MQYLQFTLKGKIPLVNPRALSDASDAIASVVEDLQMGRIYLGNEMKSDVDVTFTFFNGPAPKTVKPPVKSKAKAKKKVLAKK